MKETFPSLTGIRFPAALAVVVYHYARVVEGFDRLPPAVTGAIDCGPVAVSLFFILSGFLLGCRYPRVQDAKAFWTSRFARLYPAYLFSFLIFVPIAYQKYIFSAYRPEFFIASAVLNLSMLQSWTPLAQSWNGPSWSLSAEAFFYFVFPFVINKLNKTLLLWGALGGVIIFAAIGFSFGHGLISEPVWRCYLENNPLLLLPLFMLGIVTAWMLPGWRARVGPRLNDFLLILSLLCVAGLPLILPFAYRTGFIVGGAALFLVVTILGLARHQGVIQKLLANKILLRLGSASYILYILQAPAWHVFRVTTNVLLGRPALGSFVSVAQFVLFLPLLAYVSILLEQYLEKPLNKWILTRGTAKSPSESKSILALPVVTSQAPFGD